MKFASDAHISLVISDFVCLQINYTLFNHQIFKLRCLLLCKLVFNDATEVVDYLSVFIQAFNQLKFLILRSKQVGLVDFSSDLSTRSMRQVVLHTNIPNEVIEFYKSE